MFLSEKFKLIKFEKNIISQCTSGLMELFVANVPYASPEEELRSLFKQYFTNFTCKKGKGFAFLSVPDEEEARRFFARFGKDKHEKLILRRRALIIEISRTDGITNDVGDEKDEKGNIVKISFIQLDVGVWTSSSYDPSCKGKVGDAYFSSEWRAPLQLTQIVEVSESDRHIDITIGGNIVRIPFYIVEGDGIIYCQPRNQVLEVYFSLIQPPEIFFRDKVDLKRIPEIDFSHKRTVGTCFVYKCTFPLSQKDCLDTSWNILAKHDLVDSLMPIDDVRTICAEHYGIQSKIQMEEMMKSLPILVAFQIQAMVSTGSMFPSEVVDPVIQRELRRALNQHESHYVAEIIREVHKIYKSMINPYKKEIIKEQTVVGNRPNFISLFTHILEHPPHILHQIGNIILVNHVYVTPTGYILNGPIPERSNRVIRKFERYQSNFLRVSFTDENGYRVGYSHGVSLQRLYENQFGWVLKYGISLCGRNFKFLAFSSSSLRDHACWFFAPSGGPDNITVDTIRAWMGDFKSIRCPARYAARMGQCFTSTVRALTLRPDQIKRIPDIIRKPYCFSDGIGNISPDLAQNVWESVMKTNTKTSLRPNVFQIRFGGFKGVVSVNPELKGEVLCLRPSMKKFTAPNSYDFEVAKPVVRWTQGYLNRYIIMLLEHLGVPEKVFLQLQQRAVKEVNESITSTVQARKLVKRFCEDTHIGSVLRGYWGIGLDIHEHPLFMDCMDTLRKYALKELQQRARIPVPDSFLLMGVLDETNTLKEGEVFICLKDRIGTVNKEGKQEHNLFRVIEGQVLVTRNPALHPGDIQYFKAVNMPRLYHLYNTIVFSQAGDRPGPNMLSGGDLDGDEFFITKFPDLLFNPNNIKPPASYPPADPINLNRDVTIDDVAEFFVGFMQNDELGHISNMHLAIADKSKLGPSDPNCLILAQLFNVSVDYPKTGRKPEYQRKDIRVVQYPDFMNEGKVGLRKRLSYESQKALGKLFRDIQLKNDPTSFPHQRRGLRRNTNKESMVHPHQEHTTKLWTEIKKIAVGWENHIVEARHFCKSFHSGLQSIMITHSPSRWKPLTEAEVLTACFVLDRNTHGRRTYNLQISLRDAVTLLVRNYKERLTPCAEEDLTLTDTNQESDVIEIYKHCQGFWSDEGDDNDNDNDKEEDMWSPKRVKNKKKIGELELARAAAWYYVGTIEPKSDRMTSFAFIAADVLFSALAEKR